MTPEKFGQWRKEIAAELVMAYTHYHIWEQLWPSTEQLAKVLNRYISFFQPTRQAHVHQFFLCVAKITDKRKDSKSLWRLLDEVEKTPSLVSRNPISTATLRAQIESYNDVLKRIRTHRNKRLAHIDESHSWPDSVMWSKNPVTVSEAKKLLTDLEHVFNKLSSAHDGQVWSLKVQRPNDTSRLLEELYKKVIACRAGHEPTS